VRESFRDLRVWQEAIRMSLSLYRLTSLFPSDERWGLTSQTRRAGVSTALNIAEGYGRASRGEYLQFLGIARGSLCEVETLLVIARDLGYGNEKALSEAELICTSTSKLLNALIRALRP
jgi:four helix bundle protein